MNYLDEHIISLKAKIMDQATVNPDDSKSIPVDIQDLEQDGSTSEEALLLQIDHDYLTLGPRTILHGEVGFHIPKSFSLMPVEQAVFKYPSNYRPEIIYTPLDETVSI